MADWLVKSASTHLRESLIITSSRRKLPDVKRREPRLLLVEKRTFLCAASAFSRILEQTERGMAVHGRRETRVSRQYGR
jgi:hypothetical protein